MKRLGALALRFLPSCHGLVAGNRRGNRRRRQAGRPCNKPMTHKRNGCFSWRCTTQRSSAWKTDAWRSFSHSRRRSCWPKEVCGGGTGVSAGLKVYHTVHGEFHADVAATLNHMGGPPAHVRLYAQAEPLLTLALAIKERLVGLDHSDVALSVVILAQLRVIHKSSRRKRNRCTVDPWRSQSGRWGRPIQRSRRCWRTLPKCCGNEGVQTRRSRRSCGPKTFARSGVEPAAPSSVAYPLWQCTTSRLPSTGA